MKILFLIHDLGPGGAEKVLVNLVNNLDCSKFDVTVMTLFGGGVNEQFLGKQIKYKSIFKKNIPGNSKLMKLLSPVMLHRLFIKERYDLEISYLEGPSARIISGCGQKETKTLCWIHVQQHTRKIASGSFRTYREAVKCYQSFDDIICVSEAVKTDFLELFPMTKSARVFYNTNETDQITKKSKEPVNEQLFSDDEIKLCGIGKLMPIKGFDKLAHIHWRLIQEGFPVHTYLLGDGPEQEKIYQYIKEHHLEDTFTFLGYQTNPYKYLSKCDIFVCASTAEGFSTAATEALITGVPVVTTPVAGMYEMLGDNQYGIISETSSEESLYEAVKELVSSKGKRDYYRKQAVIRGRDFSKTKTVECVEKYFQSIVKADDR